MPWGNVKIAALFATHVSALNFFFDHTTNWKRGILLKRHVTSVYATCSLVGSKLTAIECR